MYVVRDIKSYINVRKYELNPHGLRTKGTKIRSARQKHVHCKSKYDMI